MRLLLAVVILDCVRLAAQTTAGLEGTVSDPSGLAIANAAVSATEEATSVVHRTRTDHDGHYVLGELPPGLYRVEASAPDFQNGAIAAAVLSAGQVSRGDFQLQLRTASGSVEVRESLPLIGAGAAEWGNGTERETLESIPLNGRDLFELSADRSASTVTNINRSGFVGGFGTALSLNGGRPDQNAFRIDGIYVNDATGLPPVSAAGHLLGIESIEELSVVANPFSAEYGRMAAAMITAVSKSGGNEWHGALYEYLRNNALDARNFFDVASAPQSPFRRNQFGGLLSGPILRDKLFFLVNPEFVRQSQSQTSSAPTPNALARQGLLNGAPIPVAASVQPYLALYPLPNGQDFGDGTGEYTSAIPTRASDSFFSGKVAALLSSRWRTAIRGTLDRAAADSEDTYQFYDFHNETHYGFLSSDTQFISSPSAVQTLRAGISRNWNYFVPNENSRVPASLSFLPGQSFGVIEVTGLTDFGNNQAVISRLLLATTDAQAHYELSFAHGKQSWKIGAGYAYNQTSPALDVNTRGLYVFGTLATFLQGRAAAANLTTPGSVAARTFVQRLGDAFAQYENRLTHSLTLSAGLRYEPYSAPTERNGLIATAAYPVTGSVLSTGGPMFRNPSLTDFSPRVALAWDPNGAAHTVVRAGFGMFNDILGPTTYVGNRAFSPSQYQNVTVFGPSFPNLQSSLATMTTPPTLDLVDDNVQQPYVLQYHFLIEHEVGQNLSLEAGYSGSRGAHLAGHVGDINPPVPQVLANGATYFPPGGPLIDPAFRQIGMLRTQFNLFYDALVAGFRKRFSHGLRMEAHYTFGKAIDNTSDVLFQDFLGSDKVPNIFNYRANLGLADYDVRHAFSLNYSYLIPWRARNGWGRLVNDWQWSGLLQAQSGHPFSPDVGFDRAGIGGLDDLGQRPDLIAGAQNVILGSPNRYFNPLAFSLPAVGTLGNLGRNALIGPGLFTLDMALQKTVKVKEKRAISLRFEAFNSTNHPNFQLPSSLALFNTSGTRIGSAGQITATSTSSRQLQVTLRYAF
jgi:hypothetical protein